jgi:hypothetical protein
MDLLITFSLLLAAFIIMFAACKGLYHLITNWGA